MPSTANKILKPKEYQNMINKLNIEGFEFESSSILETRMIMVNLEQLEEILLGIKRNISRDMRAIKLKYLDSHQKSQSSFLCLKKTKNNLVYGWIYTTLQ